jgi:lipoyl(octanoyl) transferase
MPRPIEIVRVPGRIGYAEMLAMQRARQAEVAAGHAPDTLYLLQHTPTITLGREAKAAHLLRSRDALAALGIDVIEVDRGGDVTYHGPGQLVAYPILDLNHWRTSVGWYLRTLEQVIIDTLAAYGIHGDRLEGYTGVWVGGAKVAAIGVGLRHWVTLHGIALNIAPSMAHFGLIIPCGIADKPVTTLARLLPEAPPFDAVQSHFQRAFAHHFGETQRSQEA